MVEETGQHTPEPVAAPDRPVGRLHGRSLAQLEAALLAEGAETRRAAAEYLGRHGDMRAVGLLVEVLEDDEASDVRQSVVTALGEIGHPSAIPALVEAVEDQDEAVYEAAAMALAYMGSPAVSALIEALTGEPVRYRYPRFPPEPRNRAALATLLGWIGDDRAIAPLVECLNREDPYLGLAVAEALDALAERHPEPALRSALPGLRRLARQTWMADRFHQIIRRIEEATAAMKDLPAPAAPGGQAAERLPVPARRPAGDGDRAPVCGGGRGLRRLLTGWMRRRTEGA